MPINRSLPMPVSRPGEPPGFDAREVAAYYGFPAWPDGTGITIAIVTIYGGYRRSDIETYFSWLGLPSPQIDNVSIDGAINRPTANPDQNVELVRDLEILGSVAPGAKLAVYFAPNNELGVVNGLAAAVHDANRRPSVICLTWGVDEREVSPMLVRAVGSSVDSAALVGRTVCAPAWIEPARFPGTHPLVLACGATEAKGLEERAARPFVASALWPRPKWQSALRGGGGGRLLPDVCAIGDDLTGYRCYVNGRWASVGGPGAATCIWAGLLARLDQALGRPWGIVPHLYARLDTWESGWGCGRPDAAHLLELFGPRDRP
jgi:kumamolisin